jgi:hypothetical protein
VFILTKTSISISFLLFDSIELAQAQDRGIGRLDILESHLKIFSIAIITISIIIGLPLTLLNRKLSGRIHVTTDDEDLNSAILSADVEANRIETPVRLPKDQESYPDNSWVDRAARGGHGKYVYRLIQVIISSIGGTILGLLVSIPAFFIFGGWVAVLSSGILGLTVGSMFGDSSMGLIIGVFIGLFVWFCGFPVHRGIRVVVRNKQSQIIRRDNYVLTAPLLGAALGSMLGASMLCLLWVAIIYRYSRIQYRSDIVHILALAGSILGLLTGIVVGSMPSSLRELNKKRGRRASPRIS